MDGNNSGPPFCVQGVFDDLAVFFAGMNDASVREDGRMFQVFANFQDNHIPWLHEEFFPFRETGLNGLAGNSTFPGDFLVIRQIKVIQPQGLRDVNNQANTVHPLRWATSLMTKRAADTASRR